MNRYKLPELLIKLIYSTCFFTQFLPHLTLEGTCLPRLDYNTTRELTELRLSPSNILKQLQSLDVHKASLGLPPKLLQACASGFHFRYVDYSICP